MNEILHSITNRNDEFGSPAFPIKTDFVPEPLNELGDRLRELARLRRQDPPYYLVGAISTIWACETVWREFRERDRTYSVVRHPIPPAQFTGGILRANRDGPMRVRRLATEWPVNFDVALRCNETGWAVLQYGETYSVIAAPYGNGYVSPEWPDAAGISGRIETATWGVDSEFHILHTPYNFPHEALVSKLIHNSDFHTLMGVTGLGAAFHQTHDVTEKAAIFYLGLGKINRAVYER